MKLKIICFVVYSNLFPPKAVAPTDETPYPVPYVLEFRDEDRRPLYPSDLPDGCYKKECDDPDLDFDLIEAKLPLISVPPVEEQVVIVTRAVEKLNPRYDYPFVWDRGRGYTPSYRNPSRVPEPSTILLIGIGLVTLLLSNKFRRLEDGTRAQQREDKGQCSESTCHKSAVQVQD